jgi:hypothetical protein
MELQNIKNYGHETMALGGRPKEEGGHVPLKISVNKFVSEALEKVDNKSQFIENVALPILEKLDPGDASLFLWQIDIFLSQGIIEAGKNGDFKQIQALSWLGGQLEDARKLCGLPPPDYKSFRPFETQVKEAEKDFSLVLYNEILKLCPEIKYNKDGNPYESYLNALKKIGILAALNPSVREQVTQTVKHSRVNKSHYINYQTEEWLSSLRNFLSPEEVIPLVGKIGKVLRTK